jgi:hypothetical protein
MMLPGAMLCYAGFTALCLAMDRHHQDVLGGKPGRARQWSLRLAGAALLGLATLLLMASGGWAMGLLRSLALAMASAGLLVWLLPYQPGWALRLAALAVPGALALGLYRLFAI